MRRSTRRSTKRISPPPDSSDEDEPKKVKMPRKNTLPPKKQIQVELSEDSSSESDSSDENEPKEVKTPQKSTQTQVELSESSSSESDIENYLKPVDQIDLNSSFFQTEKSEETKSFAAIESQIFAGIDRLSDSNSESERETESEDVPIPAATEVSEEKQNKIKEPKASTSKLNFQQLHDYTKKLEEAKKLVEKYEARKKIQQTKQKHAVEKKPEDISNLLALGEAKLDSSAELQASIHSSDFESYSDSEKEDWEEVEEHDIKDTTENIIPKDGVQITVALPEMMRKKKGIDLLACMRRRLNRIRKENQVLVHKVHLLCWIGHGHYVNQVLNKEDLLAIALSLIPSQHCYPPERTDLNYLEQIVKWYKNLMEINEKLISKNMSLEKALKIQINRKQAYNKKMLVYIFICILRSLGIQCRLVLSFQVAPLRPPASELHSLSTKPEEKKDTKEKDQKASTSKTKPKDEELKSPIQEIDKSKKVPSLKKPNLGNLGSKEGKNETQKQNGVKSEASKANMKTSKSKTEKGSTSKSDESKRSKGSKQKESNSSEPKKKSTSRNTKTNSTESNKQESQKTESQEKLKRRSKSTNEAKPPSKSKKPDLLKLKPAGKSKSTSEVDVATESINNNKNSTQSSAPAIPQVDGANDSEDEPSTSQSSKLNLKKLSQNKPDPCPKRHPKRLKSLPNYIEVKSDDDDDDFEPESPKKRNKESTKLKPSANLKKLRQSTKSADRESSKTSEQKAAPKNLKKPKESTLNTSQSPSKSPIRNVSQYLASKKKGDIRNDIISIMKGRMAQEKATHRQKLVKSRKSRNESDYDSDFAPEPVKKKHHDSDDEFYEKTKVKVKQRVKVKKENDPNEEETKKKKGIDVWVEVFLENEEKWISADVVKGQVHCVRELYSRASHPITYIAAWNNDNSIKDITQRYCPNWNTVTRKLRVDKNWWQDTLKSFAGRKTARDREEDEELARLQLEKPLPTTISEYKNHPLYVLKRHLLKFEAIYPPDSVTLGFVRNEPVYSRDCVHTLHSREMWVKEAKVVKPGEKPYKIVKARPKYDRLSGQVISDLPLEIFGKWQVDDYVPPVAENGIVPRNAYGNVELFKSCMLPKGTVHLQLPGLNKVAKKMNIDCAPAVVGFDFHCGWSHPAFDGFVVCEEHTEVLIAAWHMLSGQVISDLPLEVFGKWQVEDYVPPTAENGIVPRNAYGNVELFKPSMLPKGTVHLQLPGLNKVAKKMNIDCVSAVVGFDFHGGWNHPTYDGFVVCEEHSEVLVAGWYMEQEEQEKREQEKLEKRVYGNWKKLIKGLLIRERLKARYNFGVPSQTEASGKKRKSKGPKFVSKKRRIGSDSESDEDDK